MACPECDGTRWICEVHETPWPHGDCAGPGLPCPSCQPYERPELENDVTYASTLPDPPIGPPEQRGSVRSVTIEGHHVAYSCEVRTLPGSGLRPGDTVWVEFGAYWTELQGEKTRHGGQWRQCVVLPSKAHTADGVHVRLT